MSLLKWTLPNIDFLLFKPSYNIVERCYSLMCLSPMSVIWCPTHTLHTYARRELDDISFHKLSNETLDELADFFEDLGDSGLCSADFDVTLAVSDASLRCNLYILTWLGPIGSALISVLIQGWRRCPDFRGEDYVGVLISGVKEVS